MARDKDFSFTGVENANQVLAEIPFQPSTIENVDQAMFDYVNDELDLHVTTNEGFKKVSVIWVSAERAFQIKRDRGMRDDEGTLVLPLLTVERTSVAKNLQKNGPFYGYGDFSSYQANPNGGRVTVARKINHDKTAIFNNADSDRLLNRGPGPKFVKRRKNRKTVYQTTSMPIPVYVDIMYKVVLRTEYQQQMNELLQPFITKFGTLNHFIITKNEHRYESFIQSDFAQANNVTDMTEEERKYETSIEIKVAGHLMGLDKNDNLPKMIVQENAVDIKFQRERVIFGDDRDHSGEGIKKEDETAGVDGGFRES